MTSRSNELARRSSSVTVPSIRSATSSAVSRRPDLGRGDDQRPRGTRSRPRMVAQPLRLVPALLAQGPLGVVAVPRLRVAGVGVTQQVEQHQAGMPGSRAARCVTVANWRIRSPSWMNTRPEHRQPLLLGALGLGRILVAPVERLVDAGEDRASLPGLVAHGDRRSRTLAEVLVHRLRARPRASMPASARTRSVNGLTPAARCRRCGPRTRRHRAGGAAPRP